MVVNFSFSSFFFFIQKTSSSTETEDDEENDDGNVDVGFYDWDDMKMKADWTSDRFTYPIVDCCTISYDQHNGPSFHALVAQMKEAGEDYSMID